MSLAHRGQHAVESSFDQDCSGCCHDCWHKLWVAANKSLDGPSNLRYVNPVHVISIIEQCAVHCSTMQCSTMLIVHFTTCSMSFPHVITKVVPPALRQCLFVFSAHMTGMTHQTHATPVSVSYFHTLPARPLSGVELQLPHCWKALG